MISTDLVRFGFEGIFLPFNKQNEENLLRVLPKKPGAYAIRKKTMFNRLRGETDIVYFGSAIAERGIHERIRQYYHPGLTQFTAKRINTILDQLPDLELTFVDCSTKSNPKNSARQIERELLRLFEQDHLELPPFNRQGNKN